MFTPAQTSVLHGACRSDGLDNLRKRLLIFKMKCPLTWKLEAISTRSPKAFLWVPTCAVAACIDWLTELITTFRGSPFHLLDPRDSLVNSEAPEVRHQGHLNQDGVGQGS